MNVTRLHHTRHRVPRRAGQVAAVAVVGGLGLSIAGGAVAVAAPATGDGTMVNLLYSVNGGPWSDDVTAERGDTVTARLFYDTTNDAPIDGVSMVSQIPDGFTYVPGSTRNVLAPGSNVATGAVGSETKEAAVADSVWSGDTITVSPSAGFNGESNASTSGNLRNGIVRYLNLHQGVWVAQSGGTARHYTSILATNPTEEFATGTNASNTADTAVVHGDGGAWTVYDNWSSVNAIDLLGNQYLNLHQCNFSEGTRWFTNFVTHDDPAYSAGSNASNTADASVNCGSGGWNANANYSGVESFDLVDNRYLNLHECKWLGSSARYHTQAIPNAGNALHWAGSNASNSADTSVECGPGNWSFQPNHSAVQSFDLLDTSRGQGFIEFQLTSDVPMPACDETIVEPEVSSERPGAMTGSGTGDPATTASITLAEYTAVGEECPVDVVLVDDEVLADAGVAVTIDVLGNDSVPSGTTPSVASQPSNGSAVVNPDGTITYTPVDGFEGEDSFEYSVTVDDVVYTATVSILVIPLIAPGIALAGAGGVGLWMLRRRLRQSVSA